MGYETGFGGRKLMGTLLRPLLPDYVQHRHILPIVFGANVLLALLFVRLVQRAVPRLRRATLPAALLTVLYLASPFGLARWMTSCLSIWFMETYMMVLVLTWVLLFVRWRGRWWHYPLTLAVAATCCLVHHTFCCTLMPLMVALFAYDIGADGRWNHRKAMAYGAICACMVALLGVIWTCSRMTVDLDTLCEQLSRRAVPGVMFDVYDDEGFGRAGIYLYYYATNMETSLAGFNTVDYRSVEMVFSVVLLSPVVAVLWWPWVGAGRRAQRGGRWRYRLPLVAVNALTLPIFLAATDDSRWWYCYFFCLMAMLLAAAALGDRPILRQLQHMLWQARRHWPWALALLLYSLCCLHPNGWFGLDEAIRLRRLIMGGSIR